MEDDDEFGDLYTDVIRAFPSSYETPPPLQQQHHPSPPKPPSLRRPIDLNLQIEDEDTFPGAPSNFNSTISQQSTDQTVVFHRVEPAAEPIVPGRGNSGLNSTADDVSEDQEAGRDQDLAGGEKNSKSGTTELGEPRVSEEEDVVKLRDGSLKALNYGDKSGGGGGVEDKEGDRHGGLVEKSVDFDGEVHNDVKFDVEEDQDNVGDVGSDEPLIPGLSSGGPSLIPGVSDERRGDASMKEEPSGEGDDWDSDSEDDLQIVLNDDNHGPMAMDGGGVVGSDEDEDGDPLVIVADGDDPNHQAMEEQEWGEDGAPAADGERKEMGDGVKGNGGMAVVPKVGYSSHGYHPFHSQFKYVRPGAPMAGVATMGPGGTPGQVRPPINMGPIAGRGRGDWRPPGIKNGPMQKGFHPNFGMPAWGNGPLGRGFGGGLEFTLPSHKTIFEVDIDSFEEKPWKYPGVDVTDFFNFGLNEESWKDYCKQLEQLRLESTMQSKIRVYESGRTEQDYDPDMPPELAAATGINDVSAENANLGKTDVGQSDLTKESARVRPPLPTGRAIQVEGGYGERLPSIDTRPPRIRDSDAIIEIVLQNSLEDESSTGNGILEPSDNYSPKDDLKEGYLVEVARAPVDTEYADDNPHTYNGRKRELVGRRAPFKNSGNDDAAEGDEKLPFPQGASAHPDSRGQSPIYPSTNHVSPNEERQRRGRQRDRSPQMTVSQSSRDKFLDNRKEESLESMDGKHSPHSSSPATVRAADEPSFEQIDAVDNELAIADGSSEMEADEMPPNPSPYSKKKLKLSSRVEHHEIQEVDDGEDLKTARSSENSKARSGSSRDCQKLRDSAEDEVVQDRRSSRLGNIKRHLDDDEQSFRRKDRDGRPDMERKRVTVKGREDSYPYRDWDPNTSHPSVMKTEGVDRRKERDSSDGVWQRSNEDPHGRRIRTEDTRKRDFGDEMGPRHWGKIRDSDRNDKDEHLHLRKQLDNGSWRGHHDKDAGPRHRERDDTLKGRHENMDDYYSKRRKDEEHLRRDHADKEEILLGHREITGRRKRERDEILDQRRRDGQPRLRDNVDDHHSVRQKDEGWLQRERGEKQRDERHRLKQSLDESISKREREDGRAVVRSGRGAEEKLWVSNSRAKDEYKGSDKDYQIKDTGRHSEQVKRRDRIEDESLSHHKGREDSYPRGNQISNEERRSRQERLSTRNDRAPIVSDNQRVHDKKPKENTRKNRDSEGFDYNTSGISKRNQEYHSGQRNDTVSMKGTTRQENEVQENSVHRQSRKHRENASSDDEQQDSRRGRSKLERWTSHKERDFSINSKTSTSLRVKEIDRNNNGGSSLASKLPDDSTKSLEVVDNQPSLVEEKDAGDLDIKDAGPKPVEDRHLDTVAKLKKRSERFKLPMPSEKEVTTTKKMESEALPTMESEVTTANTEVKQERPARKRRWVSN